MNGKLYFAHRSEDGRTQTVLEHLTGTARLCEHFAAEFGAAELGRLAGLAHDLGKYSEAFQRRLLGDPAPVRHAAAGAFECAKRNQPLIAFAVLGHHSGLPDGGGRHDPPELGTFWGNMNRMRLGADAPYSAWEKELSLPEAGLPEWLAVRPGQTADRLFPAETMFFTRMLYSCLTDADFLDTEGFMSTEPVARGGGEQFETLEQKLFGRSFPWFPPKNALNAQRCAILTQCFKQGGEQKPGLFTLTIPTGGGKTVVSLAFALRHAKMHGKKRVVYVVPYTSIIEQNAKTFRDILGEVNVLEHHCGMQYDIEKEADPETMRLAKATENWDMPVIVTTAVQFFESLYANRSSRCRKLHNLANSVIILDEAQMIPLPYLRPCVFALAQLLRHYGASVVLCTATQPALEPVFREFLPDIKAEELCPETFYKKEYFCRVSWRREGILTAGELAERLHDCPQVLCIVNSRKQAKDIYKRLSDMAGADESDCAGEPAGAVNAANSENFHLSTLMCPAHRKAVLDTIRKRLEDGAPCRVVSTSLIEAGVDVDFPAVFREEAGLDSILQAAGRCNREGGRTAAESVVTIFQAEGEAPSLFQPNIGAARRALSRFERPDDPAAITFYFRELRELLGAAAQDKKDIMAKMCDRLDPMAFRSLAEQFRLIEQETKTIYVPWGDSQELIDRLTGGERSRKLFRGLQSYSVAVYPAHFQALEQAGALMLLEDGSALLTDMELYDANTGLTLAAEDGRAIFVS